MVKYVNFRILCFCKTAPLRSSTCITTDPAEKWQGSQTHGLMCLSKKPSAALTNFGRFMRGCLHRKIERGLAPPSISNWDLAAY